MSLFSEYTKEQLDTTKTVEFTLLDLRVLQLALSGDTFAPGSKWDVALAAAIQKIDMSLDELRATVLHGVK